MWVMVGVCWGTEADMAGLFQVEVVDAKANLPDIVQLKVDFCNGENPD
jgi:hypothetical protein